MITDEGQMRAAQVMREAAVEMQRAASTLGYEVQRLEGVAQKFHEAVETLMDFDPVG